MAGAGKEVCEGMYERQENVPRYLPGALREYAARVKEACGVRCRLQIA